MRAIELRTAAAATGVVMSLAVTCWSSASCGPPMVCVPGAAQACACPGGSAGTQACNANGTGLGECGACAPATPFVGAWIDTTLPSADWQSYTRAMEFDTSGGFHRSDAGTWTLTAPEFARCVENNTTLGTWVAADNALTVTETTSVTTRSQCANAALNGMQTRGQIQRGYQWSIAGSVLILTVVSVGGVTVPMPLTEQLQRQ